MRTGELGFWWRSVGGAEQTRAPLAGPTEADVAIVGAGYTGLWTAYYLKRADPSLRIVVLEREMAGFGASGRNGGWVSGFFSGPPRLYERHGGREGFVAVQRAMLETVQEVGDVLAEEAIEADFLEGGHITVALNGAQVHRLRKRLGNGPERGLGEQDLRELGGSELTRRIAVQGARSATFTPHVARVHPVKLLLGLAEAVERLGVEIYEGTAVSQIRPHCAVSAAGAVSARWVVRATEGYTADLRGLGRTLVPMNSSMIVTAPLPRSAWEEIGWQGGEVLSDAAHVYVYLQRTEDGRIAIGGRGAPYRFASGTGGAGDTSPATVASLRAKLLAMFPQVAGVDLDHAWSGVLGVPRDWGVSVAADAGSGLARAGGYVGEGVAASNLAARILRDLLLGRTSELTALPWVGRGPRRWEPEPLRWAAIHSLYSLYRQADRSEQRSGRQSRLGAALNAISGRE